MRAGTRDSRFRSPVADVRVHHAASQPVAGPRDRLDGTVPLRSGVGIRHEGHGRIGFVCGGGGMRFCLSNHGDTSGARSARLMRMRTPRSSSASRSASGDKRRALAAPMPQGDRRAPARSIDNASWWRISPVTTASPGPSPALNGRFPQARRRRRQHVRPRLAARRRAARNPP